MGRVKPVVPQETQISVAERYRAAGGSSRYLDTLSTATLNSADVFAGELVEGRNLYLTFTSLARMSEVTHGILYRLVSREVGCLRVNTGLLVSELDGMDCDFGGVIQTLLSPRVLILSDFLLATKSVRVLRTLDTIICERVDKRAPFAIASVMGVAEHKVGTPVGDILVERITEFSEVRDVT